MARALADAFVRIRPDVSGFRAEVDAKLTAAMAGLNKNILITANTAAALSKMADLRGQMDTLGRKVTSARLVADDKPLQLSLAKIAVQLQTLEKSTTAKKVTLAGADKVETQLMALNIAADQYMAQALDKTVNLDTADAQTKLAFLITATSDLSRKVYEARVGLTGDAAAKMAALTTEVENLTGKAWEIRIGIHDSDIKPAADRLIELTKTFRELTYKDIPAATAGSTRLWGVWGALGARVALFGGAATVSGWHIAIDGVIEALAVLIPAITVVAAGLTAFGIAGADAAKEVYNQFLALHTVSDATGKTIAPMTGSLEKLHNAVRPQVFQLLGDAIQIASAKTGLFNKLALATGSVLDKLAAHLTVIITSAGPGLNTFLAAGAKDAAQLGRFLVNIGDALLNLIKVTQQTHIADFLLQGLVAASKLFDLITKLPTPLLAVVVGLHGLYLWGGLAATGLLKLITPLAGIAGAAGGIHKTQREVTGLAETDGPMQRLKATLRDIGAGFTALPGRIGNLGKTAEQAGTKVGLLARAGNLLSRVPWQVWPALAAAALGFLIFSLVTAKSAAQRFGESLQNAFLKAGNLQVLSVISSGMAQLHTRTESASASLNASAAAMKNAGGWAQGSAVSVGRSGLAFNSISGNAASAREALAAYSAAQKQLNADTATFNHNAQYIAKQYGISVPAAIGLATVAGVKLNKNITDQSMAAKTARTQIAALVAAYAAMGAKGGQLGNDMEVLKSQTTDQYKAIQQLNTGWDTFIANMTGSQLSFDNVALGFNTLKDSATTAGNTLGKTHDTISGLGKAIDGLTPKDLALNQAFTTQVGNINTLIDSFRTAGLSNDLFKQGVKDSIAPMLKYAKGSQEATAQLIGLAQEAGFTGPVSMKALTKWLGNTGDATRSLKDITNQATIQEALLTGSMRDQGKFIANQLIGDINNEILATDGVREAARKYGDAIATSGKQSDAAHAARHTLVQDIINAGLAAGDSKNQIAAMITKVLGIPKRAAMELVMTGTGSFTVKQLGGGRSITSTGVVRGVGGHTGAPAAAGMLVSGGTAGRDSVLINAMPGEVVVPTHMVKGGAVDHLKGKIPGFAAGGLVTQGNQSVLSGQFALNAATATTQATLNATVAAMRAALKSAEAAATAAANAFGAAGPGGGTAGANAALARRLMPAWGSGAEWSAWNYVAMRESGWSQFARNQSSGAYGIPQALPPSKMGPAANPPQSNPAAQINWMISYIRGRYGDPIGAANHERSFNWYGGGTGGAAPGWAMVGEKGPELVNFSGGETVLSHGQTMAAAMGGYVHGYAKGTKLTLNESIDKALQTIKHHADLPQQYNRLEIRLESWQNRLKEDRQLLKSAGLKGGALRSMKEQETHDKKMVAELLKQMAPISHERKIVRGVQALVDNQEKGLANAIGDAHSRGMNKLAGTLTRRLNRDKSLDSKFGNWLNRLGPVYTSRQKKSDAGFIDSIINDAIADHGLPLIPYDKGGWLPTGLSLAYNGLGRPEKVGGAPQVIQLQVSNSSSAFDMFMTQWLQHAVQVKGGGDVQVAFGRTN